MTNAQLSDAIRDVTAGVQRVVDAGERSTAIDVHDLVEILLMLADRLDPPLDPSRRPRVGYDNVEFEEGGHTIVATVIGDEDDVLLLGNPHWDDIWRIPLDRVRLTDRDLNHPPADW